MCGPSRRFLAVLLLPLLLLLPSLAEAAEAHADVTLNAWIPPRAEAAEVLRLYVAVRNLGPDAAGDVVVRVTGLPFRAEMHGGTCVQTGDAECTIARLGAASEEQIEIAFQTANAVGAFDVEILADAGEEDVDRTNDRVSGTMELVRAPRISLWFSGEPADPGSAVEYTARIANQSAVAAEDLTFTLPLPEGWSFVRSGSDELQCSATGREVRCSVAHVAEQTSLALPLVLRAPPSLEGVRFVTSRVAVTTRHGLFNGSDLFDWSGSVYRHLIVTSTGDEGEGTLREAIERANATPAESESGPNKVVFDLAGAGAAGVFTIRPTTPLPPIRATTLTIDGSTQTVRHGDTNPAGPEIEIDGSLIAAGEGLEIRSPWFVLRDVVINRFPDNGLAVRSLGSHRLIERCYIGTDATGRHAAPNRSRGIVVEVPQAQSANVVIRNNVISGNGRSAVFFSAGYSISIQGNRIGVAAGSGLVPLGNGASGIYVGAQTSAATITNNVVAFNAHAGLAIDTRAFSVAIHGNTFTSNGGLAIDYGLDGVTPNFGAGHRDFPNHPTVISARYDTETSNTRIEGRADLTYLPMVTFVELFVSERPDPRGYGEGQRFLGRARVDPSFHFSLDVPRDLRGYFITATSTVPNNYYPELVSLRTSEFGPAFRVEGEPTAPFDAAAGLRAGADLSLLLNTYQREVAAGNPLYVHGVVENIGPETAEQVIVDLAVVDGSRWETNPGVPCSDLSAGTMRCTLGRIEPFGTAPFSLVLHASLTPGTVTIRGAVSSEKEDRVQSNNESTRQFVISAAALLQTRVSSPAPVDPGATADYTVSVTNHSGIDAYDVALTIPMPEGWSLTSGPAGAWRCDVEEAPLVCRSAHIAAGSTSAFGYTLRAPASKEGQPIRHEIVSATTAAGVLPYTDTWVTYAVYRLIEVTTTSDAGAGSLRSSIETANLFCGPYAAPCRITFALPGENANSGVFTIRPATPLPRLTAYEATIDGRTQTLFGGDTNPLGPEIELNGSLLAAGSGLEVSSEGSSGVRGLTVNGFPWNGIHVIQPSASYFLRRVIADNYIGTDPTGTHAVPNRLRGLFVETDTPLPTSVDVIGNLFGGNSRAAIFVASGRELRIVGNRFGLTPDGQPLGNGASGIYLGLVENVTVHANTIAHSGHAGIALDRAARNVSMRANSIFDNGGLAIDSGLDLVTRNDDPGRPEHLAMMPVILSATWDASSGVTRVEGVVTAGTGGGVVELFANDQPDPRGFGEAQTPLASLTIDGEETQPFAFTVPADLRGKFVTSTFTERGYVRSGTSEVSAAEVVT